MPNSNFSFIGVTANSWRIRKILCFILWLLSMLTASAQEADIQKQAPEFIKTSYTQPSQETQEVKYYDDFRSHLVVYSLIIAAYGLYWYKARCN